MADQEIEFVEQIRETYPNYLNDESGIVSDGYADRLYFPKTDEELRQIVTASRELQIPITISGGGTGLSGGRVPHGGWIVATDKLTHVNDWKQEWRDPETGIAYGIEFLRRKDQICLRVPVAMTLKSIQNCVREERLFYPPDATERSAFIGGNVATNASGARSFKYGATREWVQALRVILPSGEEIRLDRDGDAHQLKATEILIHTPTGDYRIPRPRYQLPETRKNVAGPVITDQSQPIDLFIGTGGLFGVVSEVTLRLIPEPPQHVSIFAFVRETHQALELIEKCRAQRDQSHEPIPMSVEYLGPHATSIIRDADNSIPESTKSIVILEQDAQSEEELYENLEYWVNLFEELGIQDSSVAQKYQEIEHHKFLRHIVPETVNATVKGYGQSKLGTDYSVPAEHFRALFDYVFELGERFEQYQKKMGPEPQHFGFAFWAHAGDAHVHLNLLPRTDTEMVYAKSIFVELMHQIITWKGSIAAEHGLGKKYFDGKPALEFQYGKEGITQIQEMKKIMDPHYLLNPDNLVGRMR